MFAGDLVEHRQKTNLYQFMIGEKGVGLIEREEEINRELSALRSEIKDLESKISRQISSSASAEEFVDLQPVEDIDEKISQKKRLVEQLEEANEIRGKESLNLIDLPQLPLKKLQDLLGKSLDDISEEAESAVNEHLERHLDEQGESWLERGFEYTSDGDCPFCGQPLKDSDLISAYKSYFDDTYNEFKQEIQGFREQIHQLLGEDSLSAVQEKISENRRLVEFWSDYEDLDYEELDFSSVRSTWVGVREALDDVLERKKESPLDVVEIEGDTESDLTRYNEIYNELEKYNQKVKEINKKVEDVRESAVGGEMSEEKEKLLKAKDIKIRFSKDEVISMCEEFGKVRSRKESLEEELEEVREESKKHSERTFKIYKKSINKHLKNVGAGFRIVDLKINRSGHSPSSQYRIQINDEEVKLGSENTAESTPRFKTALSSGDKRTLAYAFFLARMEEEDLSQKIIVLDDPVTSLDIHREEYACETILRMAQDARQMIVLSHRPELLHLLDTDSRNHFSTKLLEIFGTDNGCSIRKWDKNSDLRDDFFRDYDKLVKFMSGKNDNKMAVLRSVRPLLEASLQHKFPNDLVHEEGLGDHKSRIENADPSSPLSNVKEIADEIESIHNFTKSYMHGRSSGKVPTRSQLEGYVGRALDIVHR